MAKYIGRRVNVGIGKESVRGTGVAPSAFVPKLNIDFDDKANKARSGESFGQIAGTGSQSVVTGRFSEGSLEGEINVNSFGLILLAVFGSSTPTTVDGAYKHTYTLTNSNQHQSLTISVDNPNNAKMFKGCVIDSLEITASPDEIVKFNVGFKGKKGNDTTMLSTNYTISDYKFVGRDLQVKIAADTASLNAATAVSIKELKLTINKNAEYEWILGTLEPDDVVNKQITIQGQLTINYEDDTWKTLMTNGTYQALRIYFNNARTTIGSANTPQLLFEFPVVDFAEWEPKRDNDAVATQKINFTVLYDSDNARFISDAHIVNDTPSY
jgi:hypothetical protein